MDVNIINICCELMDPLHKGSSLTCLIASKWLRTSGKHISRKHFEMFSQLSEPLFLGTRRRPHGIVFTDVARTSLWTRIKC